MHRPVLVAVLVLAVPTVTAHFFGAETADLERGSDVEHTVSFVFQYEENSTYFLRVGTSMPRHLGVDYSNVQIEAHTMHGAPPIDRTEVDAARDFSLRLNNSNGPEGQTEGTLRVRHLDTSEARPGRAWYNLTAIMVGYEGSPHGVTQTGFWLNGAREETSPQRTPGFAGLVAFLLAVALVRRR